MYALHCPSFPFSSSCSCVNWVIVHKCCCDVPTGDYWWYITSGKRWRAVMLLLKQSQWNVGQLDWEGLSEGTYVSLPAGHAIILVSRHLFLFFFFPFFFLPDPVFSSLVRSFRSSHWPKSCNRLSSVIKSKPHKGSERFSNGCRKTKTKSITYQLDYSSNLKL